MVSDKESSQKQHLSDQMGWLTLWTEEFTCLLEKGPRDLLNWLGYISVGTSA